MKRVLVSAISIILATSLLLCGCKTKTSDKKQDNSNLSENTQDESKYALISDGLFNVKPNKDYGDKMSFEEAANRLAEVQPKSKNDNIYLLTAGGVGISATAVRYSNIACTESYASSGMSVEDKKDEIKSEIESVYKLNTAVQLLSNEFKVGISDQDLDNLYSTIDQFKETYGSEYDNVFEQYAFQTPYYFFYNELYNIAYANLHEFLYGENGDQKLVDEFYNKTVENLKASDMIRAKHILISFPEDIEKDENGNIPESAKAQTLEKANEVLKLVNKGQDFDTLIKEYGQDPGTASFPHGYIFGKGEMVQEFEDASYALEEGKTSGLIETSYGYHIILRLPLEDRQAIISSEKYLELTYNDLYEKVEALSENVEIVYSEDHDKMVEKYLADFNASKESEQTTEK